MATLTIVDTFGFFFRSFHALPKLTSPTGFPTGLLTGFTNLINQLITEYSDDYLVFALDSKGASFRTHLDPSYKANRPEPPLELTQQLPVAIEWIAKMGFSHVSHEGFEADDIICTFVRYAKQHGIFVRIVSHDKDLYQLIDDGHVILFNPVTKTEIDSHACLKKFGVTPSCFTQYQALVGDSSDNILGVKGIGAKTAQKLISEYQTLENLYANLDTLDSSRIKTLLQTGKESAFLSRTLVTLRDDACKPSALKHYSMPQASPLTAIASELKELGMNRALKHVQKEEKISNPATSWRFETILLDSAEALQATLDAIPHDAIIALDTETDSLDTRVACLVGFSFSWERDRGYYVPIAHTYLGVEPQVEWRVARKALRWILSRTIIGQNLKFDLAILYRLCEVDSVIPLSDTMILAWLLNPESSIGLDQLMKRHFNHTMIPFSRTVKKGDTFQSVPIHEACRYAGEDAVATRSVYDALCAALKKQECAHLLTLAHEIEIPFINTLIRMEKNGICVDIALFESLERELEARLTHLTCAIHADAGEAFNLNSTQQLGRILFERLGLKASKKTKTGYSTNESVLQKLKHDHPIIPNLLEYRELYKLKSTYIQPLLSRARCDESARIYTSFLQTGTATGRLSSKNPNLQNIPVKTELGKKIRQGFVATAGCTLISIDYSQIELRLLAHFSEDLALLEAYQNNKDIHRETAVKIFGESEADSKRHMAKSINFGLIYGMGARRLGDTLGITHIKAKQLIDSYFNSFPTVKQYLATCESRIQNQSYTETLLGRRRYFDFKNAAPYQKAGYLREGINTIFQGSAADLMKMSMNAIDRFLQDKPAKMLLQVHDELIFEAEITQSHCLAKELSKIMENIYPLRVPLRCNVHIGDNWGELK
jgi:DNA polymerase I